MLTYGCMLRFGSRRKPCLSPLLPRNRLPAGVPLKSLTTLKSLKSLLSPIPLLLSRKPCFCGSFGWKFCCCWSFNDLKVLKDFKDPKVSDVLLRITSHSILKLAFLRPDYRPPISGRPSVRTALACCLAPPNRLCIVSVTLAARLSKSRSMSGRYYRLSVCSNAPASRYGCKLRLSLHNFGNSAK